MRLNKLLLKNVQKFFLSISNIEFRHSVLNIKYLSTTCQKFESKGHSVRKLFDFDRDLRIFIKKI